MEIQIAFTRYGERQPVQRRSVLLFLASAPNGAEAVESTAFLTEHPTAGWLWHFHDARFHPRQPDADDWWAYYPKAATDVLREK